MGPGGALTATERTALAARSLSLRINWFVERFCVLLLVLLVLDVWLGVLVRYVIPMPITFTEELARYLMIWMALLAVSAAIVHRQHIGVEFVFTRLPAPARRWLAVAFDLIGFLFFFGLFWYGLSFVERGMGRTTMIYGMPRGYAFAAVPVAALLAAIQLLLTGIYDFCSVRAPERAGTQVATATIEEAEAMKASR
jgi:TRAP-type transport system small permease protein